MLDVLPMLNFILYLAQCYNICIKQLISDHNQPNLNPNADNNRAMLVPGLKILVHKSQYICTSPQLVEFLFTKNTR